MNKLLPKTLNHSKGFSLIEILVVVSIIAILSVIGVAIYSSVQGSARDAKRREEVDAMAKALEVNRNTSGNYIQFTAAQFGGGVYPGQGVTSAVDPQGSHYCIDSAIAGGVLTGNPGLIWTTTCPTGFQQVGQGASQGLEAGLITQYKVCTWLERTSTSFCVVNLQ